LVERQPRLRTSLNSSEKKKKGKKRRKGLILAAALPHILVLTIEIVTFIPLVKEERRRKRERVRTTTYPVFLALRRWASGLSLFATFAKKIREKKTEGKRSRSGDPFCLFPTEARCNALRRREKKKERGEEKRKEHTVRQAPRPFSFPLYLSTL